MSDTIGVSMRSGIKTFWCILLAAEVLLLGSLRAYAQPDLSRRPVLRNPSTTKNMNGQAAYAARVRAIAADMRWSLAFLYSLWEEYQSQRDELLVPKRNTDIAALTKQQDQTKTRLLVAMKKIEANAGRLRGLSPVPKSWKKLDNKLIDAAWDFARGEEAISTWLLHPSGETKNTSNKHLRRAQSTLDGVLQELQHRTDGTITGKSYTP